MMLVVGFYQVDLFCLGLKNTFFEEMEDVDSFNEKFQEMEPDEFKAHLENIIKSLSNNQVPNYLFVLIFTMSVDQIYSDFEKLLFDYKKGVNKALELLNQFDTEQELVEKWEYLSLLLFDSSDFLPELSKKNCTLKW